MCYESGAIGVVIRIIKRYFSDSKICEYGCKALDYMLPQVNGKSLFIYIISFNKITLQTNTIQRWEMKAE